MKLEQQTTISFPVTSQMEHQTPTLSRMLSIQRVVVLGAGGVGKSALVQQYTKGHFVTAYKPTVEDLYMHQEQISDSTFIAEILDTAGLHRFPAMREVAIKSGHAFIIVYAVDSSESFCEAMSLLNMIHTIKGDLTHPITLIGNKTDSAAHREVAYADAVLCASETGCDFIELSATSHDDVTHAFNKLLMRLHDFRCVPACAVVNHRRRSSLMSRLTSLFSTAKNRQGKTGSTLKSEVEPEMENNCNGERRGSFNNFLAHILSRRKSGSSNRNESVKDPPIGMDFLPTR